MKESAPHTRLSPFSPTSYFFLLFSLQVIWFFVILSVWLGFLLHTPFDADYASGEMLDHLMAWGETGRLYSSIESPPYRVLNYPPLFFILAQSLSSLRLSPLTAGRVVTLLAMGTSFFLLFQWLKKLGCKFWAAVCIVSLSASSIPLLFFAGQFHLQWLAVALSFGGLFLLQKPKSFWMVFFSGVLCALACLTKQTQIVTAFIGGVWLARYHRRSFLPFLTGFFLVGGLGAWWMDLRFGEQVWRHLITYTIGTFSWGELAHQFFENVFPWSFFTFAAFYQAFRYKERQSDLRWWYFIGTFIALFSSARHGASYQYFIEWNLATLLWIGPWFWQGFSKDFHWKNRFQPLLGLLLIAQVVGADFYAAGFLNRRRQALKKDLGVLQEICGKLPSTESPILTEEAALARACGLKPAFHPFIMTNLARRGLWNEQPFLEQISSQSYPVILLPFDPASEIPDLSKERWTTKMIQTIAINYHFFEQRGRWRIFTPSPHHPTQEIH